MKRSLARALFLALLLAILAGLGWFVAHTDARLEYDDAGYLTRGLYHAHQVEAKGGLALLRLPWSLRFEAPKPPLFHGVLALAALTLGSDQIGGILLAGTILPLALLLAAVYALARRAGGPAGGSLAVLLLLCSPMTLLVSTRLLVETLFSALVVGGALALVARCETRRPIYDAALGVASGLALLAKLLAPLFLGPTVLVGATIVWRREGPRPAARMLAVAGAVASLIAGFWYLPNALAALNFGRHAAEHWPNISDLPGRQRPFALADAAFGPGWIVVLILGLAARRIRQPERPLSLLGGMALATAATSALVILSQPVFDPRYWLPALALLAAWLGPIAAELWKVGPTWRRLAIGVTAAAMMTLAATRLLAATRPTTPWGAASYVASLERNNSSGVRLCTLGNNRDWNFDKLALAVELAGGVRPVPAVGDLLRQDGTTSVPSFDPCDVVFALPVSAIPDERPAQRLNVGLDATRRQLSAPGSGFLPWPSLPPLLTGGPPVDVFGRVGLTPVDTPL
jgi:hypothetical protein